VKTLFQNKLLVVVLGLGFVCILGYFVSDLDSKGTERSLASSGFNFDKELSDLASRRVIKEMQTGRGVELGSSPSELERFLFEDLKGEFSLEVEPEKAFRLSLMSGKKSSVLVPNRFEFVKEALGFLFDKDESFRLVEKKREPASQTASDFSIIDDSDNVQAEVSIELTKSNHLKSLMAKVSKP
jgi:hypothetical protein